MTPRWYRREAIGRDSPSLAWFGRGRVLVSWRSVKPRVNVTSCGEERAARVSVSRVRCC